MAKDNWAELNTSAPAAAKRLLGALFVRDIDGQELIGRIVETEAYDQTDAASHSYRGITPRTEIMFGPPGFLYVYFTYGMHYCCNIVCGPKGRGAAVLLRGIEPIQGRDMMSALRRNQTVHQLTNGPAKICQAFGITKSLNGHDLTKIPLRLRLQAPIEEKDIMTTPRIGIRKAVDVPWRFYLKDNEFVSKSR